MAESLHTSKKQNQKSPPNLHAPTQVDQGQSQPEQINTGDLSQGQILYLQRTVGNRATQSILNNRSKLYVQRKPTTDDQTAETTDTEQGEFLPIGMESDHDPHKGTLMLKRADVDSVGLVQRQGMIQRSPSDDVDDGDVSESMMPLSISQAPSTDQPVQRASIGAKVGYTAANLIVGQALGPLTDLKHLIRLGYYKASKEDTSAKEAKLKKRVGEEWTGPYRVPWMNGVHVFSTFVEKCAALSGAIGLLATIASVWAPPAAVVATAAAVIAAVLAGTAFISRSLLSAVSFYKAGKATTAAERVQWKNAAFSNLFKAVSNLIGVVAFGVSAGVGGGVDFSSVAKTGAQVGTDIGIGGAGAVLGETQGFIGEQVAQEEVPQQRPRSNAFVARPPSGPPPTRPRSNAISGGPAPMIGMGRSRSNAISGGPAPMIGMGRSRSNAISSGSSSGGGGDDSNRPMSPEQGKTIKDIEDTLNLVQQDMGPAREEANQEKSDANAAQGDIEKANAKLGRLVSDSDKVKNDSQAMQSGMDSAQSEVTSPTQEGASETSEEEVQELENDVARGEQAVESGEAQGGTEVQNKESKKGLISRIKSAASRAGKSISAGARRLFGRLSNLFSRVKALISKAAIKVRDFILHVTGLDKKIAAIQDEVTLDATNQEQSVAALDDRQTTINSVDEQLSKVE